MGKVIDIRTRRKSQKTWLRVLLAMSLSPIAAINFWMIIYWWLVPANLLPALAAYFALLPFHWVAFMTALLLPFVAKAFSESLPDAVPSNWQHATGLLIRFVTLATDVPGVIAGGYVFVAAMGIAQFPDRHVLSVFFWLVVINSSVRILRGGFTSAARNEGVGRTLRWRRARSASDLMRDDPRAPIVYLRSFDDEADKALLRGRFSYASSGNPRGVYLFPRRPTGVRDVMQLMRGSMRRRWRHRLAGSQRSTVDQQAIFASFFSEYGPYVGLARPGEGLGNMDLGAAKFEVTDIEWREKVIELTACAAAVVIDAATTGSLEWEIRHVVSTVRPTKVILMTPFGSKYDAFYRKSKALFPRSLPYNAPDSRLIIFAVDWTPNPLENPTLAVADALEPFCRINRWIE